MNVISSHRMTRLRESDHAERSDNQTDGESGGRIYHYVLLQRQSQTVDLK